MLDEPLARVEPLVRRTVARKAPAGAVDDLVQDVMSRLGPAASQMAPADFDAYAVVAARNAVASHHRGAERVRRLTPSLADTRVPSSPDEAVLADVDRQALRRALDRLSPADRRLLAAHHVEDIPLDQVAVAEKASEPAVRVRLARARAHLRLEYLLAVRGIEPSTDRCRQVLLALANGDRRQLRRVRSDDHLAGCDRCGSLAADVVERRRPVLLAPFVALAAWWQGLGWGRRLSVGAAVGAVGTAGVAAAVVVAGGGDQSDAARRSPPPAASASTTGPSTTGPSTTGASAPPGSPGSPAPDPDPTVEIGGVTLTADPAALSQFSPGPVEADGALVDEVAADEGFWVAADAGGRLWVQMRSGGEESEKTIQRGQRVSFGGDLVAHQPGFAAAVGVTPAEGAAVLDSQARHIEVADVRVRQG